MQATKVSNCQAYRQKILLCQLDLHHDHFADWAKKQLKAAARDSTTGEFVDGRLRGCDRAVPLFRRFETTLICNDRNSADSAMKAALKKTIDPRFSFRPSEIGLFVHSKPSEPHKLNTAVGEQIWEAQRALFEGRIRLVSHLCDEIASDTVSIERGYDDDYGRVIDTRAMLVDLASNAAEGSDALWALGPSFLQRSTSRDGRPAT